MLDLISLIAAFAYIAFMLLGILRVLRANRERSLFEMERALRFYLAAALFQLVNLGANVMDVDDDGWTGVAISAFNLVLVTGNVILTGKQADRMEGVR